MFGSSVFGRHGQPLAWRPTGAILSPCGPFTLEYWKDDRWLVGRLVEVRGVMSQGEDLAELEGNIRDAYRLMAETDLPPQGVSVETRR